ncbi:MAG: MBL fold metallo-hydrolase [Candidatus Geothermincolia bacterium]
MPGVFRIRIDLPLGPPTMNVYLIEGEPLTLIDTGPVLDGVEATLFASLEKLGHPASELKRIIVTHTHPDHRGLAARLREVSGAAVMCHRLAEAQMRDYRGSQEKTRQLIGEMAPLLGVPGEIFPADRAKNDPWMTAAESVDVDRLLDERDVCESDRYPLRVIYTPGHAYDHIVLWQQEAGVIFAGDHVLDKITPNPDLYPPEMSPRTSGLPDYLVSLEFVRELGATRAFPGHGEPIEDLPRRIDEIYRHHVERIQHILEMLQRGETTVLLLTLEFLTSIAAEPSPINIFLGMREVYGHLVLLEQQGLAAREVRDGAWYFRAL